MGELLDRHLDEVAVRLGSFLRGFEDSSIHLGTPAQFAREFRRVMEAPVLRTHEGTLISYAQAVESHNASAIEIESLDPVSTLIKGLKGLREKSAAAPQPMSLEHLRQDLGCLLRLPRLRFYLALSDRELFLQSVEEVAGRLDSPFVAGARDNVPSCPACGTDLVSGPEISPISCGRCGVEFESFVLLPMVSAILAVVSYDVLREVAALDVVETYQEESAIRPTCAVEEIP